MPQAIGSDDTMVRYGRWRRTGLAALMLGALAGCGSGGSTAAGASSASPAAPASSTAPASSAVSAGTSDRPGTLVAVTGAGALVVLDPKDGHETARLVGAGVAGDAVQLSPDGGEVYYEKVSGCRDEVWKVPAGGGTPTRIAEGGLPALSPDGRKLAYVTQPLHGDAHAKACGDLGDLNGAGTYKVLVRDLAGGATASFPADPKIVESGLPFPIGHLGWSPDGARLVVSISTPEDNYGWALRTLEPGKDTTYQPADDARAVPLAKDAPVRSEGMPSYYAEGVYLPDGTLLVARHCCAGFLETDQKPRAKTSAAVMIIDPATGAVRRTVAVGAPEGTLDSLDADRTGTRLLFLSDGALMVSEGGAPATRLAPGTFLAADW